MYAYTYMHTYIYTHTPIICVHTYTCACIHADMTMWSSRQRTYKHHTSVIPMLSITHTQIADMLKRPERSTDDFDDDASPQQTFADLLGGNSGQNDRRNSDSAAEDGYYFPRWS